MVQENFSFEGLDYSYATTKSSDYFENQSLIPLETTTLTPLKTTIKTTNSFNPNSSPSGSELTTVIGLNLTISSAAENTPNLLALWIILIVVGVLLLGGAVAGSSLLFYYIKRKLGKNRVLPIAPLA